MTNRGQNIMVGLTTIVGLVALGAMLMLFGYLPAFLQKGYVVTAALPTATGLSVGGRVQMRGIDVGRIENIQLDPETGRVVHVMLKIREDVRVPEGARAMAELPLLGGAPRLSLDLSQVPADQPVTQVLPTDGSARIQGRVTTLASELAEHLGETVGDLDARFEQLATSFEALSTEWVQVGKNFNTLIEPRDPAAVDEQKMQGNLSTIMARADERIKELGETIDGLNKLINDPKMQEDLRAAVANVNQMSSKLDKGADQALTLLDQTRQNVDQLTARYLVVAEDLSTAVTSLREALDAARSGRGTVAKLLNDPALYDNLNDTIVRTHETITDIKLLVEKWQTEGLPVKVR